QIGLPNVSGALQKLDEPGRPDIRQSIRGPGTGLRIAVPVINITKTRLNDPHMWFLGTNEQPGDYRSSGCTGCHTVYANDRDPEEAAVRGKWSDPEFLRNVSSLNPKLKDTQFADYHGHGWNFRAVFKRDRHGTLLDAGGKSVADDDPDKFKKAVHLSSIHMDLGFQCVDCHFAQDSHGNGHIYGEVAAAIEIDCSDCHGTATKYPRLFTSGPASQPSGTDMSLLRTQDGRKRFEWRDGKLYQRAATDPDKEWEVSLVKDTINPASPRYNAKAARAKLMSTGDSMQWGPGVDPAKYAHGDEKMTCYTCHLSWTTSC